MSNRDRERRKEARKEVWVSNAASYTINISNHVNPALGELFSTTTPHQAPPINNTRAQALAGRLALARELALRARIPFFSRVNGCLMRKGGWQGGRASAVKKTEQSSGGDGMVLWASHLPTGPNISVAYEIKSGHKQNKHKHRGKKKQKVGWNKGSWDKTVEHMQQCVLCGRNTCCGD